MAARKPKPVVVEPDPALIEQVINAGMVESIFGGEEGVCVTRADLDAAVTENMKYKLGAGPVEGQLDDLWRRLRG